jgi:S-DNA-T family DNA segregation ATPase FtsK/SpoIIIE
MSKQKAVKVDKTMPSFLAKRLTEGGFIFALTIALFLLISLFTYHPKDPGFTHVSSIKHVANAGGYVGAWLADVLFLVMGYLAYLIPPFIVFSAWQMMRERGDAVEFSWHTFSVRFVGFLLTLFGGCGIVNFELKHRLSYLPHGNGGVIGELVNNSLIHSFNAEGAIIIMFAVLLSGITLLTGLSWVWLTEALGRCAINAFKTSVSKCKQLWLAFKQKRKEAKPPAKVEIKRSKKPKPKVAIEKKVSTPKVSERFQKEQQLTIFESSVSEGMPALSLLSKGQKSSSKGYTNQELEQLSRDVEAKLTDFGIDAQVVAVHPGPVITRFELQLAAGLKVSKLTALSKDLARSLSVISVRVVEVIPGKTVVGLELPNKHRETVSLSEVLSSESFEQARSSLSLALGVDIAGHPMIVDLAKMPHLLVAGTTGSGKSVGINAMLLSLLFKSTPEKVRLILVDPKMLELSVYDGIPHLLTPVVTDMKEAASALRWSVGEMERRYRLMAALGVRNISGYNNKVKEAIEKGEPIKDPLWKAVDGMEEEAPTLEALPFIVIVIDELADMMMVVGKKVEQLIARIAQKARAAGIHLILATQRPSVDVLTGLIKSNIPTRISFQVSSKIDSRTILDQQGADQLLGMGDMLFLAPGTGAPLRVHGAFVDDKEVHRVAKDWRSRGTPEYIDAVTQVSLEGESFTEEGQATEDSDPLYDQAVEFVTQSRKASISSVQRRLKIGYNRAARLVEEMERTGVVGPMESGSREVLVPPPPQD